MCAARIEEVHAAAYVVPTDAPEADGTIEWSSTTLVVVEAHAGGAAGFGYTYADRAAALVAGTLLREAVLGCNAHNTGEAFRAMTRAVRNAGRPGVCAGAISAVDCALWDLKAKLLGVALADLIGPVRPDIPAYGSGGFTSYDMEELGDQLGGWARQGFRMVKMKVGADPHADAERAAAARRAIGPDVKLFVDANGAYDRKQALAFAERFAEFGVSWFEEPVSSDDLEGLRLLRDRAPSIMAVAAGEYGYDAIYFRRMLAAGAVDVLQADATRCGGITGFMQAAALAEAFCTPLSSHTAPSIHAHLCCAASRAVHLEWFHDHARIEAMLFDGAPTARDGKVAYDPARPGLGVELRRAAAAEFEVS
jgi:L-alanine-DL-glutamate epimerase-like enolase superfamily enzyme